MEPVQMLENGRGLEIILSDDATEAFIFVRNAAKQYTREEIVQLLSDAGVTTGLRNDEIKLLIQEKKVGKKYFVAQSRQPVNGTDGWFEFLFDTDVDTKPKVLHDGSVDYSEYGNVPFVDEGQKIAIYHPATPSKDGENFHGETIVAQKGKELARLKGKGFYVSENGKEYFAQSSGRATFRNDRLLVENEFVVDGDVSLSTGDVNFANDIHIRGNVLTGVSVVSAKGSIIVDGYVEACELYAGKDVVLKNGMQGNGRGKIIAGGSVSGKFFEQVHIESGGDVRANAIMNSRVTATQDVVVSGRFGIIIGGEVHAERYISATIIGNMAEVPTRIMAGIELDLFSKLMKLEKDQAAQEEELQKIVKGINQIDILIEKTKREDLSMKKVMLIRGKIEKENQINELVKEKQKVMDQMSRANMAKITVQKTLYPGTKITINGVSTAITEEQSHVEISAKGSVIEIN